jgi:hypothetical protein
MIWVAVGMALLIVVLLVATRGREKPAPAAAAAPARQAEAAPQQAHWDELDGKTMAEWMKENNKDNAALRERRDRMKNFQTGKKD